MFLSPNKIDFDLGWPEDSDGEEDFWCFYEALLDLEPSTVSALFNEISFETLINFVDSDLPLYLPDALQDYKAEGRLSAVIQMVSSQNIITRFDPTIDLMSGFNYMYDMVPSMMISMR